MPTFIYYLDFMDGALDFKFTVLTGATRRLFDFSIFRDASLAVVAGIFNATFFGVSLILIEALIDFELDAFKIMLEVL